MNPKKLLIVGATGGTGRQIVAQAIEAGHEVTAFGRDTGRIPIQHERLRRVAGTVTDDVAGLADAMRGHDVVISALGRGKSLKSTNLIQRSVPSILSAMQIHGVRRLIFTSAIGVGESIRDASWPLKLFSGIMLRDIYADKLAGEALVRRSDLDWTLVQPVQLTDGPLTRTYRVGERLTLRGMASIARADVAHFILSQLDDISYIRKIPLISY